MHHTKNHHRPSSTSTHVQYPAKQNNQVNSRKNNGYITPNSTTHSNYNDFYYDAYAAPRPVVDHFHYEDCSKRSPVKQSRNSRVESDPRKFIYVKKGETIETALENYNQQPYDVDRFSSYSTNSSDEDASASYKPLPQQLTATSAYGRNAKNKVYMAYFNGEHIYSFQNESKRKASHDDPKVSTAKTNVYVPLKFGASDIKNGPCGLENIPTPSFCQ